MYLFLQVCWCSTCTGTAGRTWVRYWTPCEPERATNGVLQSKYKYCFNQALDRTPSNPNCRVLCPFALAKIAIFCRESAIDRNLRVFGRSCQKKVFSPFQRFVLYSHSPVFSTAVRRNPTKNVTRNFRVFRQ